MPRYLTVTPFGLLPCGGRPLFDDEEMEKPPGFSPDESISRFRGWLSRLPADTIAAIGVNGEWVDEADLIGAPYGLVVTCYSPDEMMTLLDRVLTSE